MRIKDIGQRCANYRRFIGATQAEVANSTGYSVESICAFEHGRTNNAEIFSWYIGKGVIEHDQRFRNEDFGYPEHGFGEV